MVEIYGLFVFVLGMIIGSFLNVVIYRYNTGLGLNGRSMCFTCRRTLSWHELIPIVSFINQGGKCLGCKSRISVQYPIVEAITGFVFVSLFLKSISLFPFTYFPATIYTIVFMYLFSLLIVIAVYDYKHQVIPEGIVWVFNILAFLLLFFFNGHQFGFFTPSWQALIAGPFMALPFFLIWFLSRGTAMGFGDVKLALGLGWLLGISASLAATVVSFWIGAIVGIILILLKKNKYKMKSHIAFGPFLILATFFVYLFGVTIKDIVMSLQ